jgi:trigger factor
MEPTLTDLGPCTKRIEVTVPETRIQEALAGTYAELRRGASLPGFRPGHVPIPILRRRFGKAVAHQVLHDLIREAAEKVAEQCPTGIIGEPELQDQDEDSPRHSLPESGPLTVSFLVEVVPDFPLPHYREHRIRIPPRPEVRDEAVDAVIRQIVLKDVELLPVEEGGSEPGDLLFGELELAVPEVPGVAVLPQSKVAFFGDDPEVCSGVCLDAGPETFVGLRRGDSLPVRALLGEEHPEPGLRGRTATGTFVLNELKRRREPTIDDEFAKGHGAESLEDLRSRIRGSLAHDLHEEAVGMALLDFVEDLLRSVEIPLPPKLHALETQARIEQHLRQAAQDGGSGAVGPEEPETPQAGPALEDRPDPEPAAPGPAEEPGSPPPAAQAAEPSAPAAIGGRPRAEFEAEAAAAIRRWLLMSRIAAAEGIEVQDEDLEAEYRRIAHAMRAKPGEIRSYYARDDSRQEVLRRRILETKTMTFFRQTLGTASDESGGEAPRESLAEST